MYTVEYHNINIVLRSPLCLHVHVLEIGADSWLPHDATPEEVHVG